MSGDLVRNPLSGLIDQLEKLPGIGARSAQRLAFFFLSLPASEVNRFAQVLCDTRQRIRYCDCCFNISFSQRCYICESGSRRQNRLCVVAQPRDVMALERTSEYDGVYHVLGGLISPIDGIHPEALRIRELVDRIKLGAFDEVILAINPTIEGDATILVLTQVLKPLGISLTQLAYGLPAGSDMDYADEVTLQRALLGRTVIK